MEGWGEGLILLASLTQLLTDGCNIADRRVETLIRQTEGGRGACQKGAVTERGSLDTTTGPRGALQSISKVNPLCFGSRAAVVHNTHSAVL